MGNPEEAVEPMSIKDRWNILNINHTKVKDWKRVQPNEGKFNELRVKSQEWIYLYSETWNHT